ncbi:universal stress protein A-like protein [Tanacetum coccineum]
MDVNALSSICGWKLPINMHLNNLSLLPHGGRGRGRRAVEAWDSPKGVSGFDDVDSIYASPEDFRDANRKDKIKGARLLEYFVKRSHESGVACEAWIKKGDPKEVICHEVKRIQPDLLVVGNRGLGPFQRPRPTISNDNVLVNKVYFLMVWVFVGTVSEFCVKHCECPVVTIKRSADETPQDPVDD